MTSQRRAQAVIRVITPSRSGAEIAARLRPRGYDIDFIELSTLHDTPCGAFVALWSINEWSRAIANAFLRANQERTSVSPFELVIIDHSPSHQRYEYAELVGAFDYLPVAFEHAELIEVLESAWATTCRRAARAAALKRRGSARQGLVPGPQETPEWVGRCVDRMCSEHAHKRLTVRQREVVELLVVGRSYRVIATKLGVCERVAKVHASKAWAKLGVENRVQLRELAFSSM